MKGVTKCYQRTAMQVGGDLSLMLQISCGLIYKGCAVAAN